MLACAVALLATRLIQKHPYAASAAFFQENGNGGVGEAKKYTKANVTHVRFQVGKHVSECLRGVLPPGPTRVPVKRVHSRHRRFIAPGASWQLRVSYK